MCVELFLALLTIKTETKADSPSGLRFRSFVSLMSEMQYAQMLGIDTLVFQSVVD